MTDQELAESYLTEEKRRAQIAVQEAEERLRYADEHLEVIQERLQRVRSGDALEIHLVLEEQR
jgi:hypothetical protein